MVKNTRDQLGRWKKGVTGNPKGRPGKYAKYRTADLSRLRNTLTEVDTSDGRGRVMMTREAAIQERLYTSAMEGNVQAQIYLARRFEKFDEDEADVITRYRALVRELSETGRHATPAEADWINIVRMLMGFLPRPGEEAPKKRRSRAKKVLKEADSDEGMNSA